MQPNLIPPSEGLEHFLPYYIMTLILVVPLLALQLAPLLGPMRNP